MLINVDPQIIISVTIIIIMVEIKLVSMQLFVKKHTHIHDINVYSILGLPVTS